MSRKRNPRKDRARKRNFHLIMRRLEPAPVDWWECTDCGEEGTLDALDESECSHETPPCDACGGDDTSNRCRPDCPAMAALVGPAHDA